MKKLFLTPIAMAISIIASFPAHADELSDLKTQIQSLSERLANIEKERARPAPAATTPAQSAQTDQPTPVTIAYPPSMQLLSGDNTLSLYGIVDMTFATQSNANAAGKRGSAPVVSWMSGNRFGINASHVLDKQSGLGIIARLENEFELPTGNLDTNNVLFNRDAWIGLQSDDLGKITFGRQNTLPRDFAQTWGEAFGSREVGLDEGGWNNNNQMQYMINYAGGANGTRYNSAVVWKKKSGAWVTGLAHQFNGAGSIVAGDITTGTSSAAALAYNGGKWNVNGTYSTANVAGYAHKVAGLGGNVEVTPGIVLRGGYFNNRTDQAVVGQRKDDVLTTSITFMPASMSRYQFDLGYYNIHAKNAGYAASGNTLGVNSDTSAVTTAADGKMSTFYAAAFYRWDRQADAYIALDKVNTDGGFKYGFTNGFHTATELGVGLRYKF